MATTGWKFPTAVLGSVTGETGTAIWSSPTNIMADDDVGAAITGVLAGNKSKTLRAYGFGFTSSDIPAGTTIVGIEVEIQHRSISGTFSDYVVQLVPDRTAGNVSDRAGSNKALPAANYPSAYSDPATITLYGSANDNWGAGLTRAQALSSNFAVDFQMQSNTSGDGGCDYIRVRLTYLDIVDGDAAITEGPDSVAGTGTVKVKGTGAIAEAGDLAAGGSAYVPALNLDFINNETPDPRIVFSGGANGTRVNAAGQIVAASAPRYDYDPITREARGLLIEESRTNYLIQSEFADGLPASRGGSVSAVAFAGLLSGTGLRLQNANPTTTYFYVTNYSVPASSARVISVFVRMDDGGAPSFGATANQSALNDFVFNLGGAVFAPHPANGGLVEDYGGGLYRVSLAVTTTATPNTSCGVIKYPANSTRSFTCSGIMVEAGTAPSSYVATGAAQVTRTTDSAVISGTDFSGWYNQDAGSLIVSFDRNVGLDAVDRSAITFDVGSASSRMIAYSQSTGRAIGVTGGSTSFLFTNLGPITPGSRYGLGLAYALDDFAACMNGGTLSTDTSGAVPTANRMVLGGGSGVSALNGHVRWARYFNQRLPNLVLQTFTTAIAGTGTLTEANDNAAGTGRVKVQGTAAIAEGNDVAAGTGETGISLVTPSSRIALSGFSRLSNRIAQ
ncbi:hypothetical protein GG804_14225 [Sphingomonas histidinilytica]|uniref:phage head spike fiber domain-containing protein n=1 Tax=Rhizorhabdus histidinilytica TaxID=439228 RepID=UPI001AD9A433|nr:hypothetical protein [Rhizorhabdus histidinilytica]MBO9377927.1 hypothetical protein [Rhizorhabdus histidinilytica]